jgi:hypothetical protein
MCPFLLHYFFINDIISLTMTRKGGFYEKATYINKAYAYYDENWRFHLWWWLRYDKHATQ